jgi:hypothetical protein
MSRSKPSFWYRRFFFETSFFANAAILDSRREGIEEREVRGCFRDAQKVRPLFSVPQPMT